MSIDKVIENFDFEGKNLSYEKYGHGHINDTFLVKQQVNDNIKLYILQRMNTNIFNDPKSLINNIYLVTNYLKDVIKENGGDVNRETLNLVKTKNNELFFKDEENNYYRAFLFITNATSYDTVEDPKDFYESAVAFGKFQYLLKDFPANKLVETIVNFHNTPVRFERFKEVLAANKLNKNDSAKKEIEFVLNHEKDMYVCQKMLEEGTLPLRVTHNDTKLNNIMIDNTTHKGICIIDLDTIMPGLSIFDFGDSIRFGANTALEDEKDLSKVSLSLELFELYVKGFLEGSNNSLTKAEIDMLAMGAKVMTLECGMRFLTDHLEGDVYFKVHRENHNLDRARTQFALVTDMENKWEEMLNIVEKYRKA